MQKRTFAVMGHPIGHTMSPFIHRRLFALSGQEGDYGVLDISPDDFLSSRPKWEALAGYNVTIPHKQRIIPFLHRLDPKAALYGSVNTVRNGSLREGFTTDPDGFLKALEGAGIPLRGKTAILGCGGAARTFICEAVLAGCDVTVAVRPQSLDKARTALQELEGKLGKGPIRLLSLPQLRGEFHLLINGTPVGMIPHTDEMPVDASFVSHCEAVFDAVYNPLRTRLIETAAACGAKAVGGMPMLVWQAAAAHTIWDGSEYRPEDMEALTEETAAELQRLFR